MVAKCPERLVFYICEITIIVATNAHYTIFSNNSEDKSNSKDDSLFAAFFCLLSVLSNERLEILEHLLNKFLQSPFKTNLLRLTLLIRKFVKKLLLIFKK